MRMRVTVRWRGRKQEIVEYDGEGRRKEEDSSCDGEYIRNSIIDCGIEKSGMAGHGMAWYGKLLA